jgi:hypothetical protein
MTDMMKKVRYVKSFLSRLVFKYRLKGLKNPTFFGIAIESARKPKLKDKNYRKVVLARDPLCHAPSIFFYKVHKHIKIQTLKSLHCNSCNKF